MMLERQDKMLKHSKGALAATLKLEEEYRRLIDSIIRNFNKSDSGSGPIPNES